MSSTTFQPTRVSGIAQLSVIISRYLDAVTVGLVLIVSLVVFTTPVRQHGDLLRYAQDDFYYYLTAARNIVRGAGSTFDGSTPTNGYHPLYELILTAAARFLPTLRGIYGFLAVLDVVSAATIFLAARALARRWFESKWFSNAFALVTLYLCFFKLYHQMEVTLALPLGFVFLLLLEKMSSRSGVARWALTGLLASLLVLSRLDTIVLVGICGLVALLDQDYRRLVSMGKALAFVSGFLPLLLLYFALNYHFFHRWMPISGTAKQLELSHGFVWQSIYNSVSPESSVFFALTFLALLALPWLGKRLSGAQRVICIASLLFPVVHWGLLFYISDWKLWGWYGYSLRFSVAAVLLLAGHLLTTGKFALLTEARMEWLRPLSYAAGLAALLTTHYKVDPIMAEIAVAANAIQAFAQQHPGRYAMGDRAGMVGYVDGRPTIQTEGLMMDDAFLNHIRRQEPLRSVLRSYRIDYYIAFSQKDGPCFEAREPFNAGPSSPVMRGEFCEAPLLTVPVPSGKTLVYALNAAP